MARNDRKRIKRWKKDKAEYWQRKLDYHESKLKALMKTPVEDRILYPDWEKRVDYTKNKINYIVARLTGLPDYPVKEKSFESCDSETHDETIKECKRIRDEEDRDDLCKRLIEID